MKNIIITKPVLLIAFNRPDTTKKVFQKIREAKPEKLYIAVDGARLVKNGESKLVEQVKEITKNVDWKCETHYKFNESNLGAEVTVSNAITWVLEKEEYVIILEDDIIAPFSFFQFAQEMLEKYKHHENIYMISSCNQTPMEIQNNEDYLFSKYGHTWGWATWKRAWERFDLYINDFDKYLDSDILNALTDTKAEKKYWYNLLKRMKYQGSGNNNWDYCWLYIQFKEQALSIVPKNHISSNIGIYGLHARGQTTSHYRPYDEHYIVKKHPIKVIRNIEYDKYHFNNHINKNTTFVKRLFIKIQLIIDLFLVKPHFINLIPKKSMKKRF